MVTPYEQVEAAAAFIRSRAPLAPRAGVILGSGLGAFAETLDDAVSIPYAEIPHFPLSSVAGHAGRLVLGTVRGVPVAVMAGRVHGYEGYPASLVAFPARVLGKLGIGALVVTNAAGGVNPLFEPGDLMRITDHVNLAGANPLTGPNDPRFGPRFPDLSHAYDPALGAELERVGASLGLALRRGVYAQMAGPSYETPAEIRMLRALGADAVGMSTVPEVIAAAHLGIRVVGISLITNLAAGAGPSLSHQEVLDTSERVKPLVIKLLTGFVPRLEALARA